MFKNKKNIDNDISWETNIICHDVLIDHIVSKAHEASYYQSTTRIKTELPHIYSNVLTTYRVDQTAESILKVLIRKYK